MSDLKPLEVKTSNIATKAVTSDKIADKAIESKHIKERAVTPDKMSITPVSRPIAPPVETAEIKDGAITPQKLSFSAAIRPLNPPIGTDEIKDGAVTRAKMADGTIGTAEIVDGAVTTPKLASSSVTSVKIAAGAVRGTEIADGAVSAAKLSTNAVETVKIKDGAVTPAKLSFTPVARPLVPPLDSSELGVGSVTTEKIAAGAVTSELIAPNARIPAAISGLRLQTVVLMGPFRRVAISIAEIVVENIRLSGISLEANLGNSGAGGLDTGIPSADTWYYLYIITNADGSLVNSLISLSPTTPNLPAGYTKKRRIGAARAANPVLPSFLPYTQVGDTVLYTDAFEVNRLVNAGGAIIFTMINAAAYIPPTSRRGRFYLAVIGSSANVGDYVGLAIRHPDMLNASGQFILTQQTQVTGASVATTGVGDCDTDASQGIQYSLKVTGPAAASAFIDVVGYYDSI